LLDDIFNSLRTPVVVIPIVQRISSDRQGAGRTEDYAAMAAHAVLPTAPHPIILNIVVMYIKGTLIDTHLTFNASLRIPFH